MKILRKSELFSKDGEFDVLVSSKRSQAATMVLREGETSGEYGNEHAGSDQWLIVLSGAATALVSGTEHHLHAGDCILIEAGEDHQIKTRGTELLRTFNIYTPPAY